MLPSASTRTVDVYKRQSFFRVTEGCIERVVDDGNRDGEQWRDDKGKQEVESQVWDHWSSGWSRNVCDADVVVLKPGVDVGFPDLANQLVVQGLVGIGFAFELLVLEGVRVDRVPLALRLGDSLLQDLFPIERFAVLSANSLGDVRARVGKLLFDLGELGGGFLVFRVI